MSARLWTVRDGAIIAALVGVTLAVYLPVVQFGFLDYDDGDYVARNPHMRDPLSAESLRWALTGVHSFNWHPLTTLTHLGDAAVFGLSRPGGHHLTNVLLHAAAAVLLYLALRMMTGSVWRSAVVAAVFAWHPLRVESVAWVSERKDVLSGVMWMLTMIAYVHYTRAGGARRYAVVLGVYALALLAKPVVVTLPCVLLLLDYWPLRRERWRRCVAEKLPMLALAAGAGAVTYAVQRMNDVVIAWFDAPLDERVGNAIVSYVRYLGKTVRPTDLAALYPHPSMPGGQPWTLAQVAAALSLLLCVTIAALVLRRSRPYLLVGWLWFLGVLVPMLGLVQVGNQAMADRYSYLPHIGLFMAIVWLVADVLGQRRAARIGLVVAAVVMLAGCLVGTSTYLPHWRDSESLYRRGVTVTDGNWVFHHNLGRVLYARALAGPPGERGDRLDEADAQFAQAARINPDFTEAQLMRGMILEQRGRRRAAMDWYRSMIATRPTAGAHYQLGVMLTQDGLHDRACEEYRQAVALDARHAPAQFAAGNCAMLDQDHDAAFEHFQQAVNASPNFTDARRNLAILYIVRGDHDAAIEQLTLALKYDPGNAQIRADLDRARRERAERRDP